MLHIPSSVQQTHFDIPPHPLTHDHQYTSHSFSLHISSSISSTNPRLSFQQSLACKPQPVSSLSASRCLSQFPQHQLPWDTHTLHVPKAGVEGSVRYLHHQEQSTWVGHSDGGGVDWIEWSQESTFRGFVCVCYPDPKPSQQLTMHFSNCSQAQNQGKDSIHQPLLWSNHKGGHQDCFLCTSCQASHKLYPRPHDHSTGQGFCWQ